MEIRNFTQFVNLLASTNTIKTNPAFDKLMTCVMSYNGICVCGGKGSQEKTNKHSECNRIYREALGYVETIKANLFLQTKDNTISFYIDNSHLIKTIGR